MEFEQERRGQPTDIGESALGAGPLRAGHSRLPGGRDHPTDQREQDRRGGGDPQLSTAHESRRAIAPRITAGRDRERLHVAAHVFRQQRHGTVALGRILSHRGEYDRVQVAAQPPRRRLITPRFAVRAGPHNGSRGDKLTDFVDGPAGDIVGPLSGEQFVQQHAEPVDIRHRRHSRAAKLLRAGVLRCQHLGAEHRRHRVALVLQQLGDAEVEQLRHAVGGDQDVRWLDVAMHDEVLMRVGHGGAHLAKQSGAAPRW